MIIFRARMTFLALIHMASIKDEGPMHMVLQVQLVLPEVHAIAPRPIQDSYLCPTVGREPLDGLQDLSVASSAIVSPSAGPTTTRARDHPGSQGGGPAKDLDHGP